MKVFAGIACLILFGVFAWSLDPIWLILACGSLVAFLYFLAKDRLVRATMCADTDYDREAKEWSWRHGPGMLGAVLLVISLFNLLAGGWEWHHVSLLLGSLSCLRLWLSRREAAYPDAEQVS
jgi:hypothetical protein